ncbi:hypothetical protein P3W24_05780 [Luteibacter sp. PPL201]|uniref:Uncharacterized protein n=1 Tax=Luteibacter sahnii TaxID=3021977 RepID=A0ABT6B8T5_9GAMM|nr:hypothetical protein [Luteibacter sp. PPL193]MDY1549383.1 hypothetical protein [Luteibacter sp. PPL193]
MSANPHAGTDLFERILSASGPLVALRTSDAGALVEQFRLVARRTGQAAYLWRGAEGLVSLRDAQMRVPGCARLGDALRYILQSLHFGVYLLEVPAGPTSSTDSALLRQLARAQTGHVRRVVLLGADPLHVGGLGDDVIVVDADRQAYSATPRLRDGRWVV